MNEENVQLLMDQYLDTESWVFMYMSEYRPRYIYLKDVVMIGSLDRTASGFSSSMRTDDMIYVDMFMTGGFGRIIVKKGRNIERTQSDYELHEALLRSWKECKKVQAQL